VWGTALHASAGDRLAARIGPLGYLAHELADELPGLLARFGEGRPALDPGATGLTVADGSDPRAPASR
jgi:hypothetical protein